MQRDASVGRGISDGLVFVSNDHEVAAPARGEPLGRQILLAFALGFACVAATVYGTNGDFGSAFARDNGGMYEFLGQGHQKNSNYRAPVFFTPFYRSSGTLQTAPLYNLASPPDSLRNHALRGFGVLPRNITPLRQSRFNQPRRLAGATDIPLNIDASGLPRRSFCVRLCDGYYFPVAPVSNDGELNAHESLCAGVCPGAPTRLFVMPGGSERMEDATSRDGKTYSALPVAFRHTGTSDNTCTCRPNNIAHTKIVSVLKDFTLRQGDLVMSNKGFRVFRGAAHYPYGQTDFMSLAESGINSKNMAALSAIESATKRGSGARISEQAAVKPEKAAMARPVEPTVPDDMLVLANGKRIRRIGGQQVFPGE